MDQASEVLGRYESTVQGLAKRLRPYATSIDERANDRSDYVSMLRARAWHAHTRLQEMGCAADKGFVWVSLRNLARDARYVGKLRVQTTDQIDYVPEDRNVEAGYEAKEIVSKLRCRLSSRDMRLLEARAMSASVSEAWRLLGRPGSHRVFRQRMAAVVSRAKKVLEGLSIFGPELPSRSLIAERSSRNGSQEAS